MPRVGFETTIPEAELAKDISCLIQRSYCDRHCFNFLAVKINYCQTLYRVLIDLPLCAVADVIGLQFA
jgi:hypothetical protein